MLMADSGLTKRGVGRGEQRNKVTSLEDALALIHSGSPVWSGGSSRPPNPETSPSSSPPGRGTARGRAWIGSAATVCCGAWSAGIGG
jgi:hypothetical protein